MTNSTTHRIKGDFMDDGYIDDLAPRTLEIVIEGGKVYSAELLLGPPCGQSLAEQRANARLTIDVDGSFEGWGIGRTFAPDAGELARVGLT
jgi:hypothetical protein